MLILLELHNILITFFIIDHNLDAAFTGFQEKRFKF